MKNKMQAIFGDKYVCYESDRNIRSVVYTPTGDALTIGAIVDLLNAAQAEVASLKRLCRTCVFCGTEFPTLAELKAHCGQCEPHPLAQENKRLRLAINYVIGLLKDWSGEFDETASFLRGELAGKEAASE